MALLANLRTGHEFFSICTKMWVVVALWGQMLPAGQEYKTLVLCITPFPVLVHHGTAKP
jgi:hypothetical protein